MSGYREPEEFFENGYPIFKAEAPGRLDFMGGISDYSGGTVLQWPIHESTSVSVQRNNDDAIVLCSPGDASREAMVRIPVATVFQEGPVSYSYVAASFDEERQHWAAYVVGVLSVLLHEKQIEGKPSGMKVLVSSAIPEGKGVSSSAALEVATIRALCAAYGIELDAAEAAVLCQKAENLVAGAPCGLMDQITSMCGDAGELLHMVCQPARLKQPLVLPEEVTIWGLDSGIRHAVTGSDYATVRAGAFMGYRIIADKAGLFANGEIRDSRWFGYLANMKPSEYEAEFADGVPDEMSGREFLDRYEFTTDPITRIDPETIYPIRRPTAHPIYENHRVQTCAGILKEDVNAANMKIIGELMHQSHVSYSICGLGSTGTDRLVQLVAGAGSENGLFGAKITGGGSGGTVAVFGLKSAGDLIHEIAQKYEEETGHSPHIFSGTSAGAMYRDVETL